MAFILVNIGCIECGVSSKIVGVFSSKLSAEETAEQLRKTHAYREGGQNEFEVFPMPEMDFIDPEYLEKRP